MAGETRVCSKCSGEKPIQKFNFKNRAKGLRHKYCADCGKQYASSHYERNKPYYIAKALRNNLKARQNARTLVLEYLKDHPCVDCGESDTIVLQFDHVRGRKQLEICLMVSQGSCRESILAEIAKCEVRCANCHTRKTARDRNYHDYMGL
jgi:hypothetical protein